MRRNQHAGRTKDASASRAALRPLAAAFAVLASLSLLLSSPVRAADEPPQPKADANPLYITLGSYAVWAPRFEGSTRHDIAPWPIISWRRADEKEWLELPTDGLDISLIETDNFRAGPVGFLRWQRDNSTIQPRGFSRVGRGHSSIDLSLEGGGFLEYWPTEWLRTRLEVRESLLGASGLLAVASTDLVWKPSRDLTMAAGPRVTLADRRFMTSYYGVSPTQAATSGLSTYAPQAGLRSVGAGAFIRYKLSPNWTTQAFIDYNRLTGEAGDSPVILNRGSPDQYMVGLGLSYTFKTPW